MVFEAHGMSFLMYRTLIIRLCHGKDSFPFYGTFNKVVCAYEIYDFFWSSKKVFWCFSVFCACSCFMFFFYEDLATLQ